MQVAISRNTLHRITFVAFLLHSCRHWMGSVLCKDCAALASISTRSSLTYTFLQPMTIATFVSAHYQSLFHYRSNEGNTLRHWVMPLGHSPPSSSFSVCKSFHEIKFVMTGSAYCLSLKISASRYGIVTSLCR
jgi:hypothetical protein